jgi:CIC family chloride channel protein
MTGGQGLLTAFGRYNRAYFQRWLLLGALIGVASGLLMALFFEAIRFCTHLFLGGIAGYVPPQPSGEGSAILTPIAHPWLIPVATTLGGLLTGVLVYSLAPETAHGGTDAAILSFHEREGQLRSRVPVVKLVASALTIGSGGSAGREGAAAQIMAGTGSWLARALHLDEHDRRIAVVVGIGSGIGTIFRAPFSGALFAAEVLYKRDFEADAIFPTFIASVVGFAIYGAIEGWTPMFGMHTRFAFQDPRSLSGFLILGICSGGLGLLFHQAMRWSHSAFARLPFARMFRPALGGLLVGLIGMFLPGALSMGYGYVQFGVNNDYTALGGGLLAVLVFAKIATTALTIGSGASGGDVAPAIVVGGFLGGALWAGLHQIAPGLVSGIQPGAFVVVGMAAFFGGISKTPLAMILMVAEMTGQLSLIAPAMLATMVAYLITGETSIYENQVPTRLDSPAHKYDYALPLLQTLSVRDAMVSGLAGALATATPDTPLETISSLLRERRIANVPIIEEGRLVGVITAEDLGRIAPEKAGITLARQVMSRTILRAFPDESLYQAWLRMSRRGLRQLAIVDRADPTKLLGMVTADTIAQVLTPTGARRLAHAPAPAPDAHALPAAAARQPDAASRSGNLAAAASDGVGDDEDEDHELRAADVSAMATMVAEASREAGGEEGSAAAGAAAPDARAAPNGRQPARISGAPAAGDPLLSLRVADAMLTTPRLVRESAPIAEAWQLLEERGAALMVIDGSGRLVGIVTRSDLRSRLDLPDAHKLTVGDVAVRNLVTAQPNEPLAAAVRRMSRLGLRQLPVVGAELPTPPLGLLRRSDVFAAYEHTMEGQAHQVAERTPER